LTTPDTQTSSPQEHSQQIIDAIKLYLSLGWSIIPLPRGQKVPVFKWRMWSTKAADGKQWTQWWNAQPGCNVAVVYAGSAAPDGFQLVCVDTDSEQAEAWVRQQQPLPPTALARTAQGFHRYYYAPADREHFPGADDLPEVRAGVHYSVLPPSLHPSGVYYEWCDYQGPLEAGIADLPQWGIDLMPVKSAPVAAAPLQNPAEPVPEGRRNDTLFRLCARWRAAEMPEAELRAGAHTWNAERCTPPLEADEVDTVVGSVLRYAPGTSARVQEEVRRREHQPVENVPPEASQAPREAGDEASLIAAAGAMVNAVHVGHQQPDEGTPPRLLSELAAGMIEDFERERLKDRTVRGLRTGNRQIDWQFGGFWQQRLIIVQGPTGYGKTTFADSCAFATALASLADNTGEIVAVFMLEDSKDRLMDSWMGYRHQVPKAARRAGSADHMTLEIEERIIRAYAEFPLLPIAVTDDMREIGAIEAHIRKLAEDYPLAGVIVDHAQEVEVPTGRSRHEEVTHVGVRMQHLADKLELPIMLLSQTTQRDGEFNPEYSKALRQKATLSLIVTRGEMGDTRQEAVLSNRMTVYCDKARRGDPFEPITLFGDWATGKLYDEWDWNRLHLADIPANRRDRGDN
jgi:hypothetical protein